MSIYRKEGQAVAKRSLEDLNVRCFAVEKQQLCCKVAIVKALPVHLTNARKPLLRAHMVKASGQIEQELASLQQRTEEMSDALELLYEGYLKALSEASKRQLVLAAYHLCTQAYPDKFLLLSWDRRNQLQQSLQAIASSIYEQLATQRDRAKTMSRRPQQPSGLEFLQRLLESRALEAKDSTNQKSGSKGVSSSSSAALNKADEKHTAEAADQASDSARLYGENPPFSKADRAAEIEPLETPQRRATDSSADRNDSSTHDATSLDDLSSLDFESELSLSDSDTSGDDSLDSITADMEATLYNEDGLDTPLGDDDFDFEMEVPAADQRLSKDEEEDLLSALEGLARRSLSSDSDDNDTEEKPLVPIHLVKQQVLLEKAIRDVFSAVSDEANDLLQKAEVMPKFPKALMAAAVDARGVGEPASSAPNVVKVSVRVMQGEAMFEPTDSDEDEPTDRVRRAGRKSSSRRPDSRSGRSSSASSGRSSSRTSGRDDNQSPRDRDDYDDHSPRSSSKGEPQIRRVIAREAMSIEALPELAAISLRLSEVEFSDPTVSAWRSKLRQKLSALKKLGMQYKKTQRALETAQAEDAWRSSWTARPEADEE